MSFVHQLTQIDAGASYSELFLWWTKDSDGARTPVDLTGYKARLVAVTKAHPKITVLDWSTDSGNIVIAGNKIELTATAIDTTGMNFYQADYDLLVWPDGSPEQAVKFCAGSVTAKPVVAKVV